MRVFLTAAMLVSLMLSAAIFGFFYAWICSTMWGLDQIDPRTAITAMQGMNASVRNIVFAPAFFGTPFVAALTGIALWISGHRPTALFFGAGALIYGLFGMVLTMVVNVPMNEALALTPVPDDQDTARAIWDAYSHRWQGWNIARTIASGAAFLLMAYGAICVNLSDE